MGAALLNCTLVQCIALNRSALEYVLNVNFRHGGTFFVYFFVFWQRITIQLPALCLRVESWRFSTGDRKGGSFFASWPATLK